MSVLTGALGSLGPKLLQLLHDEYKLQKGVKKQVEWLHRELESIYAFLEEVAKVPWDRLNGQVKVWVREVREASYDMEDVLDTYLLRVDSGDPTDPSRLKRATKKMGKVFSKATARRSIAGAIEDIKKHLEEIAQRRQKYKFDEIIMSKPVRATTTIDPHLTAMCKELSQLIGVDNSRNQVISMLNDDVPGKKITKKVSIVGVGGLGKTTLARVVYDSLKSQYDCAAFVSVGRDFDLVKVFKDMLFDLNKKRYEDIHNTRRGVALLIREVQEFLENKRYFIVIDDVWDVPTWEAIKLSLVENNYGSKVITTTRKFDVANEAGDVYKLKSLSDDDSMKLLCTRIFGAEGHHDTQPENVINKILKKCGGIPLAIMTMASLMAGKQKYEWSEVLSSIAFRSKGNREAEETTTILSYSYFDLPPHLRTCLLYLSTYPEDIVIEKDSLISKWVAEGFVDGKQSTSLFELGERYFNDLINRNLIQQVETWDGRVFGCRVHDMVLDLMRQLSFEENFIAILGENVKGTPALSNVRWLVHQNRIVEHVNSEAMVTGMPKVRSYTTFKCDIQDQFLRFKLLRVLDIVVNCNFMEGRHLEHLGDLLHLRYLRIGYQGIDAIELPKQIGNLKLLQTLDVAGTLPASVVHLTKLVRLCAWNKVPDGICLLVSLEELRIMDGYSDNPKRFVKELGSLRELRQLEFATDGMDETMQGEFVDSLRNMQKIQYIEVSGSAWDADTAMWEAVGFVLPQPLQRLDWSLIKFSKLPSCINSSCLPNLSYLRLAVTTMDDQDLNLLARLPALCFLYLETDSTVTASNINATDGSCFQKLRHFQVHKMVFFEQPNEEDTRISLHIWNGKDDMPFTSRKSNDCRKIVPSGMMPNLEVLKFDVNLWALKDKNGDCGNIGLEYLPSLQELRVWIDPEDVTVAESKAALAALRNACKLHPNHPTLHTNKSIERQEEEEQEVSQTADIDLGKLSLASS